MPRALSDLARRVVTLDTGQRKVDIPTDGAGHVRRNAVAVTADAVRSADDGSTGFKGHAANFNARTWIGSKRYGWWEEIAPGAFSKTVREKRAENNDITFNRDHNNLFLLARTSNGTLRLSEDETGLAVDADMGNYSYAHDIAEALRRRDLTGMSFAFDFITWEWSIADDGADLLTIREAELFDVAVVGMPAYPQTDAGLRSDLIACARAQGFDELMVASLAKRLADPDDALIEALRALARDAESQPDLESTTGAPTAEAAADDVEHGRSALNQLAQRHLAAATAFIERAVS